jgi:plastocyanin
MRHCLTILFLSICLASNAKAQVATTTQIDAMNSPSRHAWNLFLSLNHPAKSPDSLRGVPDPSKRVGDAGLTVWETWKSAGSEVFLADGSHPGSWEDLTKNNSPSRPKSFDLPKSLTIHAAHLGIPLSDALTQRNQLKAKLKKDSDLFRKLSKQMQLLDGIDPDGIFQGQGGFGETRMNKATYEFIVNNGLYNVEGQESLFLQIANEGRAALTFPEDSIEVKSGWIALSADDLKPGGKGERFHKGIGTDGKTYGLVTLHIITKDVPKWFWCSFRQIDGPTPQIPSVDTFGRPSSLSGTKWQYYELSGTQTDFTNAIGKPTLLSDPYVEKGFEKTSCITCHAMANIGAPSNLPQGDRLSFARIDPTVVLDAKVDPDLGSPIGTPPTSMFFADKTMTKMKYIQLDFLWSLSRAQRKQSKDNKSAEHIVRISEFRFDPAEITINVGDKVIWVNDGNHAHNAMRNGLFETAILGSGERSEPVVFTAASPADGFEYYCKPHPFMTGRIKVIAK